MTMVFSEKSFRSSKETSLSNLYCAEKLVFPETLNLRSRGTVYTVGCGVWSLNSREFVKPGLVENSFRQNLNK